jgi:hypothetical protein
MIEAGTEGLSQLLEAVRGFGGFSGDGVNAGLEMPFTVSVRRQRGIAP